jgi:signal peptidase I
MSASGAPAALPPAAFAALRDLAREAPVEVRVRGDCMAPSFADGDRVRVVACRLYLPGDVVVFRAADGRLVAHRLLGYRRRAGALCLVTRGDACPVHDAPVPLAAVLGRVAALRPTLAARGAALLRFAALAGSHLLRGGR